MERLGGSQLYSAAADRFIDLVMGADDRIPVPACDGWSVHCLLSHVVGLASDVVAGRVDGYATAVWTNAQVDRGGGRPMEDLVAEWRLTIPSFVAIIDDLEGSDLPDTIETAIGPVPKTAFEFGYVVDLLQHEHDLRVALGHPRDALVDHDGAVLRAMVSTARMTFAFGGLPTVTLRATDAELEWSMGRDEPVAVCEAPLVDLLRSLGGRRTVEQIRALPWTGEITDGIVEALVVPFFSAPVRPVEPLTTA
ncbi:MAG: maleylpyruvate isomerase family mycothiol-dependent enzyme [Actinomycetota bacterium]